MLLAIEHELHELHELFAVQILSHTLVRFVRLVINLNTWWFVVKHELHESHELFAVQDIVAHISQIREISGQSKHSCFLL